MTRITARLKEFFTLFWAGFMVTGILAVCVKFWMWLLSI